MHVHDEQTISICVSCCIPWQAFVSINVYRRRASFTAVLTFSSSLFLSPFEQIEYSHSLGEGEEKNRSKYEVHTYSESFKKKRRKKKCVEENTIFQMNIGVMGAVRIWCAEKKKSVCRYSTWAVAVLLMLLPCHAIPGCVRPNKTPGRLKPFVHISPAHYAHYTHTRTHDMTHIHMTEPNGPLFPLCFRVFFFFIYLKIKNISSQIFVLVAWMNRP